MQKPLGPKDEYCPQWRKPMSKVCHTCPWWVSVKGQHPQTGETLDHWGCAVALSVMATLEAANQARQGAAATESFRNEVVKRSRPPVEATATALPATPPVYALPSSH